MSYVITKSNGQILTTVQDGTVDNTTALTLVGKNYPGYGAFIAEDLVYLLENFANTTPPASPLAGQLWWNSGIPALQIYNGTAWKVLAQSTSATTQPANAVSGDLWFNSSTGQLFVYNGTAFILVGPASTTSSGQTGPIVATITDTSNTAHVVLEFFVNNVLTTIISKDAVFTPLTAISGFPTIYPGYNLNNTVSGFQWNGTANNATYFNSLSSSQLMRADQNTSTTGTLSIRNNNGLNVGTNNQLGLDCSNSTVQFYSTTSSSTMQFIGTNSNGNPVTYLTINPNFTGPGNQNAAVLVNLANFLPSADNALSLGGSTERWANFYCVTGSFANLSAVNTIYAGGAIISASYVQGTNFVPTSDETLKENVVTITDALDKVTKLRGTTFNRIGKTRKDVGVIAQEVLKVVPELVHELNDGILGVDYGSMAGLFIEAIKEQQKQIEELKEALKKQ